MLSKWERVPVCLRGVHTLWLVCCRSSVKRSLAINVPNWNCWYPDLASCNWEREGERKRERERGREKGRELWKQHTQHLFAITQKLHIWTQLLGGTTFTSKKGHPHYQINLHSTPELDHPSTQREGIYILYMYACTFMCGIGTNAHSLQPKGHPRRVKAEKAIPQGVGVHCLYTSPGNGKS